MGHFLVSETLGISIPGFCDTRNFPFGVHNEKFSIWDPIRAILDIRPEIWNFRFVGLDLTLICALKIKLFRGSYDSHKVAVAKCLVFVTVSHLLRFCKGRNSRYGTSFLNLTSFRAIMKIIWKRNFSGVTMTFIR